MKFVRQPFTRAAKFDYEGFIKTIHTGTRFLDNILTMTEYPIPEIASQAEEFRRIGLGITALGDTLAMMGIPYGSPEAIKMTDQIFRVLRDESYRASAVTAGEKGPFPGYDERFLSGNFVQNLPEDVMDLIKQNGIRNAYLNTVAPTGTTSLSLGNNCSSGLEPIFSKEYERTYRTGKGDDTKTEKVYDAAWLLYNSLPSDQTEDCWDEFFTVVDDLKIIDHLNIQEAAQKYVDQSISKTINLPKGTTLEEMAEVYMDAWHKGLKGCTTFHPEGRLKSIISSTPSVEQVTNGIIPTSSPERPSVLPCVLKEFTYNRTAYIALVGLLEEIPYEIFVIESHGENYKKRRGDFSIVKTSNSVYQLHYDEKIFIDDISERFSFDDSSATVCLMTSGQLRYGVPIQSIVDQLNKKGLITSFPKAVARALKKFIPDEEASIDSPCPECGKPMRRSEGCFICDSCGYGKCG